AERHAFETALMHIIEGSGQLEQDDALLDAWDQAHPPKHTDEAPAPKPAEISRIKSAAEVIRSMPYDLSPARLRCMELAAQLDAPKNPAP
ncbi:hypothetical protein AC792_00340, partial [Arthrobacter sp. RIT-PI-e]